MVDRVGRNTDQVKALQRELLERGYFDSLYGLNPNSRPQPGSAEYNRIVDGNPGPRTRQAMDAAVRAGAIANDASASVDVNSREALIQHLLSGAHAYTVQPDRTPGDGAQQYDTVWHIARQWLIDNGKMPEGPAGGHPSPNTAQAQAITAAAEAIRQYNGIRTVNGVDCYAGRQITPIGPGDVLFLPPTFTPRGGLAVAMNDITGTVHQVGNPCPDGSRPAQPVRREMPEAAPVKDIVAAPDPVKIIAAPEPVKAAGPAAPVRPGYVVAGLGSPSEMRDMAEVVNALGLFPGGNNLGMVARDERFPRGGPRDYNIASPPDTPALTPIQEAANRLAAERGASYNYNGVETQRAFQFGRALYDALGGTGRRAAGESNQYDIVWAQAGDRGQQELRVTLSALDFMDPSMRNRSTSTQAEASAALASPEAMAAWIHYRTASNTLQAAMTEFNANPGNQQAAQEAINAAARLAQNFAVRNSPDGLATLAAWQERIQAQYRAANPDGPPLTVYNLEQMSAREFTRQTIGAAGDGAIVMIPQAELVRLYQGHDEEIPADLLTMSQGDRARRSTRFENILPTATQVPNRVEEEIRRGEGWRPTLGAGESFDAAYDRTTRAGYAALTRDRETVGALINTVGLTYADWRGSPQNPGAFRRADGQADVAMAFGMMAQDMLDRPENYFGAMQLSRPGNMPRDMERAYDRLEQQADEQGLQGAERTQFMLTGLNNWIRREGGPQTGTRTNTGGGLVYEFAITPSDAELASIPGYTDAYNRFLAERPGDTQRAETRAIQELERQGFRIVTRFELDGRSGSDNLPRIMQENRVQPLLDAIGFTRSVNAGAGIRYDAQVGNRPNVIDWLFGREVSNIQRPEALAMAMRQQFDRDPAQFTHNFRELMRIAGRAQDPRALQAVLFALGTEDGNLAADRSSWPPMMTAVLATMEGSPDNPNSEAGRFVESVRAAVTTIGARQAGIPDNTLSQAVPAADAAYDRLAQAARASGAILPSPTLADIQGRVQTPNSSGNAGLDTAYGRIAADPEAAQMLLRSAAQSPELSAGLMQALARTDNAALMAQVGQALVTGNRAQIDLIMENMNRLNLGSSRDAMRAALDVIGDRDSTPEQKAHAYQVIGMNVTRFASDPRLLGAVPELAGLPATITNTLANADPALRTGIVNLVKDADFLAFAMLNANTNRTLDRGALQREAGTADLAALLSGLSGIAAAGVNFDGTVTAGENFVDGTISTQAQVQGLIEQIRPEIVTALNATNGPDNLRRLAANNPNLALQMIAGAAALSPNAFNEIVASLGRTTIQGVTPQTMEALKAYMQAMQAAGQDPGKITAATAALNAAIADIPGGQEQLTAAITSLTNSVASSPAALAAVASAVTTSNDPSTNVAVWNGLNTAGVPGLNAGPAVQSLAVMNGMAANDTIPPIVPILIMIAIGVAIPGGPPPGVTSVFVPGA